MSEFEDVSFFTDRSIQDDPYPYFDWVRSQARSGGSLAMGCS